MKKIALFLSIFIFAASNILHANDINDLITQIKNANPSDKRELINTLKSKLRGANQASRNAAIEDLKKSFANKSQQQFKQPITPINMIRESHTTPSHVNTPVHKTESLPKPPPPSIIKPSRPPLPHKR